MHPIYKIIDFLSPITQNVVYQSDANIEYLQFDSRSITFPSTSLFFAMNGVRHNGHIFLEEVYQSGVRNFVVSENIESNKFPKANIIQVTDTLVALQLIAKKHRQQFVIPIIGITGSNGKTVVKEWLYQVLQTKFEIVRSPRSYNSQLGVPLSVWQLQDTHTLGIFEAGVSQKNEMQNIAEIIQPTIGILTNIGVAHDENFESQAEKLSEKIQLFATADTIICNEKYVDVIQAVFKNATKNYITWGKQTPSTLQILAVDKKQDFTTIQAKYKSEKLAITIPFHDDASVENAIICWLTALYMGVDAEQYFLQLQSVQMRLEVKEGINSCTLINDSYNADITSLAIALNFLRQQGDARKTLILSDILQSGKQPEKLYSQVFDLLLQNDVQRFIGIGTTIKSINRLFKNDENIENYFFDTTDDFLRNVNQLNFHQESILLKGARQFTFERIAQRLEQQNHKTILEVNLNALKHNLNIYSRLLSPKVKLMAMVKAAAYGVGSQEVARLLSFQKIDYLCVAYADEGIELRKAKIKLPIMVLNPEAAAFDSILRYHLEAEMYSIQLLKLFIDFASSAQTKVKIHIKLNTGLNRLGFEPSDIPIIIALLQLQSGIEVASIFTHLAGTDAAEHDEFTHNQVQKFIAMSNDIINGLHYKPLLHVLNSNGIVRFPNYHFDMVRLGIGLYGFDGSNLLKDEIQVVHTLKASVSQIKNLQRGESIGYSRAGVADADKIIATISIGYADGFQRKLSNGNFSVLLHGILAPTIGNVCMDMTMIDITHIPDVKEGDEVIIFGKHPSISDIARAAETIPYEIFTNLSQRIKRVYFQE
ncbi:MAG: bifunctional UDP-N-acetylmuramoyl-tripeptide:D-alanyl-D-alanine ligase/alanine racemase [Saprospiraceae bacterium]|nr:bifunctional UDP-N-acetylmuramoyl-tripeptide:D-alanyl-D-alanine ligase/alanine racemase [Saprospiraceae bacterium]